MPVSVTEKRSRTSSRTPASAYDPHHHLALFGELDRVADQIDHDLAQTPGIADQRVRYLGRDVAGEFQTFFVGAGSQRLDGALETLTQIEGDRLELEFAGLDFGEIENIVNQAEQRFGGILAVVS